MTKFCWFCLAVSVFLDVMILIAPVDASWYVRAVALMANLFQTGLFLYEMAKDNIEKKFRKKVLEVIDQEAERIRLGIPR